MRRPTPGAAASTTTIAPTAPNTASSSLVQEEKIGDDMLDNAVPSRGSKPGEVTHTKDILSGSMQGKNAPDSIDALSTELSKLRLASLAAVELARRPIDGRRENFGERAEPHDTHRGAVAGVMDPRGCYVRWHEPIWRIRRGWRVMRRGQRGVSCNAWRERVRGQNAMGITLI
ncbi:hypothetical protein B0H10DRAFT_2216078 [Mycena sp. CBHHK59/15]|nr:hypothetical protein B0H10DRAFT_2216078 [Mycena sp. CBHHK59/15]